MTKARFARHKEKLVNKNFFCVWHIMKMRWKCSLILDENTAQIQYLVALDFFSLHFAQFQVLIPSPAFFA